MFNPIVSIYIPTKNRSASLKKAIISCINQTVEEIEVIIVNDNSEDDTEDVAKRFCKEDNRLKYIKNSKSIGACASRNIAIQLASAKYVTGLDDDDYFLPFRIQNFLDVKNKLDSLISFTQIDFDGKRFVNQNLIHPSISLESLLYRNFVGNQAFFEKQKALDIGGFDENLISYQDYDFWIRMVEKFGAAIKIDKPSMVVHRTYANNSISNSKRAHLGFELFLEKHRNLMNKHQIHHQKVNAMYNFGRIPSLNGLAQIGYSNYLIKRLIALILRKHFSSLYYLLCLKFRS